MTGRWRAWGCSTDGSEYAAGAWDGGIWVGEATVSCVATDPPTAGPTPRPSSPQCDQRIALALVLDRSGSMGGKEADVRTFGLSILDQLDIDPTHSSAAVVVFNDRGTTVEDLSSDVYANKRGLRTPVDDLPLPLLKKQNKTRQSLHPSLPPACTPSTKADLRYGG